MGARQAAVSSGGIVLVALVIAVGIVGIIVPLLPGILLVYAAILVWALFERTTVAWVTLGVVTVLIGATTLIKYMWPMKRMRSADVGTMTLLAGAVLGIIGFFVIPIVGLVIGFVLGVYLAELLRVGRQLAWPSTRAALKAAGISMLIELAAGLLAAMTWAAGAVVV